jgi:hypothetical protein
MLSSIGVVPESNDVLYDRKIHTLQITAQCLCLNAGVQEFESLVDYADPQACGEKAALSSACGCQEVVHIFQGQLPMVGLQTPVDIMYTSIQVEGRKDGMYC